MSDSKTNDFTLAEKLILENKTDEALEILGKIDSKAWEYWGEGRAKEGLKLALKSKHLYETIGNKLGIAYNLILLGHLYILNTDYDIALSDGQESLEIFQELNHQAGVSSSFYLMGLIHNFKGKYDPAIEFLKRSLSIQESSPDTKVASLYILGVVYFWKGELDQALRNCENSLKIAEEMDLRVHITLNMSQIGEIYQLKGDSERAKEYYKRSLTIAEEQEHPMSIGNVLGSLVMLSIYLDKNLEEAKKYNEQLRIFSEKYKADKYLTHRFLLGRALIILRSGARSQKRAEAELILKKIIEDKIYHPIPYIYAIIYLCEFLIEELKMTNDMRILDELNPLVNRLLNITEITHSPLWQVNAKLIQSKLGLIQMEFSRAKLFLSQAQQIAEEHDLQMFAQVISNDHDQLLEQEDMWDHLKKAKAPMAERINLASFDGIIAHMEGRRVLEPVELVDEQAILLLIIAEGGSLLFSYTFSEEWKFDDELFGGFLTAFNSISDEIFSEGLDRVKFGKQTVLMENVANFSFCYLFKGQTYPAKQKLTKFIEKIQDLTPIFQTLEKFYQTSQVAELKDIPQLESLIMGIFTEKNSVLKV